MSGASGDARRDLPEELQAWLERARGAPELRELAEEVTRALERARAAEYAAATASRGDRDAATASRGDRDAASASRGDRDATSASRGRYGMIGESPALRRVFDLLDKIVVSDVPVLIQGETGTGKELVARALHEHGARRSKPFLAENCAAVPAPLLESELFGHVRGSFTGAFVDRAGHFVAANGGTVFLDEIGDMPLTMQAKLLRVLQEGEVRPVGSNKIVKVDVRVVAATNKDLRAMCAAKTFREDLYFRLTVVSLQLPPLRDRAGDVELLARAFLERAAAEAGREPLELAPEAMAALAAWRWPGNVRELQNEIARAVALSPRGKRRLGVEDLSAHIAAAAAARS